MGGQIGSGDRLHDPQVSIRRGRYRSAKARSPRWPRPLRRHAVNRTWAQAQPCWPRHWWTSPPLNERPRAQPADDRVPRAAPVADGIAGSAGACRVRYGNSYLAGRPIRRALVLVADSPRRNRRAIFADDAPAAQRLRSSSRSASVHGRTSGRRGMDSLDGRSRIGPT
jgi:hypothetical protein